MSKLPAVRVKWCYITNYLQTSCLSDNTMLSYVMILSVRQWGRTSLGDCSDHMASTEVSWRYSGGGRPGLEGPKWLFGMSDSMLRMQSWAPWTLSLRKCSYRYMVWASQSMVFRFPERMFPEETFFRASTVTESGS